MVSAERTKTYVASGKTIGEIGRILKRYIASEIYPHLLSTFG
jgi:hypothetical protein